MEGVVSARKEYGLRYSGWPTSFGGYSDKDGAKTLGFIYSNRESLAYASGSYVLNSFYNTTSNRAILDTVNYALAKFLFFSRTGGRLVKMPTLRARALFADEDMMALPPGPAAFTTSIAALEGEVFAGTQEFGIFGWSDGEAVSIR